MKRKLSAVSPGLWTCVGLVLALILWEVAAAAGHVKLFFFSCPSEIWAEFLTMLENGTMAIHLSVTLKEAGLGLLLGGILGTVTGLILGTHPRLSRALMPLMTGLNGLPKLALGPLIIIWFGLGVKSKVMMSALMVFFIFAFNLYSGVLSVERELITAVKLLGGTRRQVMWKVVWPASIPWLLTALRTALGLSISGAIVGEYLGASKGMGWVMAAAAARFDVGQVLCCVAVIVVIVMIGDGVVRLLERKLLYWR